MRGTSRAIGLFACAAAWASGCGTGDNRVDLADLELRDLLGVAPEVASGWDTAQRAAARRVLGEALVAPAPSETVALGTEPGGDARVAAALAALDAGRAGRGEPALGAVQLQLAPTAAIAAARLAPAATAALAGNAPPAVELVPTADWQGLGPRGEGLLGALAVDLGHARGPLVVAPAPRLAAIAAYVEPGAEPARLVVNPVVIAALEPDPALAVTATPGAGTLNDPPPTSHLDRSGEHPRPPEAINAPVIGATGNPYSFYGSVAECAAALQEHCNTCVPTSNCAPITNTSDGTAECMTLMTPAGMPPTDGFTLECINLALAITSVDRCVTAQAASCSENTTAADSLSSITSNMNFVTDPNCASALDGCLAKIYGSSPSSGAPRSTSVACTNSCSNDQNCTFAPSASCNGPSCNNSLSCGSCSGGGGKGCNGASCSSSGGSGTSGGGGSCSGGSGGSSSSGGCGSCGGSSSSSSSSGCGSCGSSSSSSGGSSGCGSCGSSSSSSGGSSGCSSCGSSSSGSSCSSCGGSSSSSSSCGSGGKCSVGPSQPSAAFALALSVGWGFSPVPIAALVRRRARKKRKARGVDEEVQP